MSMVINLVEDHNIYLCEGGPVYNGSVQPTPITYLTQWKLMGNSEVHGNEIWSCGEYSAVDNKWHIRILPEGYGIVDIALDEPLRKVNDVADTIEYADGVATVTRAFGSTDLGSYTYTTAGTENSHRRLITTTAPSNIKASTLNIMCALYDTIKSTQTFQEIKGISIASTRQIYLYDPDYNQSNSPEAFKLAMDGVEFIYELATPTTEVIQVPQIEEADSYSCIISQGGKAVSWSSFETNSE